MNLTNIKNINHLWGKLLIEELIRNSINYFCIAPGSRSTPLVIGVAENSKALSCIHYDERGLAFHALGYTAATGKPACLISTSGTAVANFFPAIIEASKKKLPLIILTADRPPELRNTGANQTIDQVKMFGDYVRFNFDMPCPTQDIDPEVLLTTIDQAVYRSKGNPPGPIHINCMFREPLAPIKSGGSLNTYIKSISQWAKQSTPYTTYISSEKTLSNDAAKNIANEIAHIKKGIIIVGKTKTDKEQKLILNIAHKLNWPVFPDITSGLRLNNDDTHVIPYFDQILKDPKSFKKYAPDGVLHLGGRITSKRWYDFITHVNPKKYIMVLNHPLRNDPLHNVTLRIESSIGGLLKSVTPLLKKRSSANYVSRLKKHSDRILKKINTFNTKQRSLTACGLIEILCEKISKKSAFFLASSMSVRIMDMFALKNKHICAVGSNRGASGIDGTIACASGFATGIDLPTVLLIGDLAFLHDLNSLALIKTIKKPFVIVVMNDNGGGLFSFLPIASCPKVFEKYFATPHDLNFKEAGNMFGIPYHKPATQQDLAACYENALTKNHATIIEVELDRTQNHDSIQSMIKNEG